MVPLFLDGCHSDGVFAESWVFFGVFFFVLVLFCQFRIGSVTRNAL